MIFTWLYSGAKLHETFPLFSVFVCVCMCECVYVLGVSNNHKPMLWRTGTHKHVIDVLGTNLVHLYFMAS